MRDFFDLTFGTSWGIVFLGAFLLLSFVFINYFHIRKFIQNPFLKKLFLIFSFSVFIIFSGLTVFYFTKNFSGKGHGIILGILKYISGFWGSFIILLAIIFFFIDIYILLRFIISKLNSHNRQNYYPYKFAVLAVAICLIASCLSFIAPNNIVMTKYNINLNKKTSTINSLKAIFISDLHMGCSIRTKELIEIKNKINKAKPDIIFFGGDIFDEGTTNNLKKTFIKELGSLKSKYGSYYVIGNHDDYYKRNELYEEYKSGKIEFKKFNAELIKSEEVLSNFKSTNITPLINKVKNIDNKFYIIGRNDAKFDNESLSNLEKNISQNLPALVIDHQPRTKETSKSEKVDLQISGHTHNGQLLPFSLLDPLRLKNHYGKYKRDNIMLIVSSGVGTYGIPNRLLTKSEITLVNIKFK